MKNIRFIINPASGVTKKRHSEIKKAIDKYLDKNIYSEKIKYTRCPGHATKLGNAFRKKEYEITVAVGGDGSVNEVSRSLIHSNTALGIIPAGSGNGLARSLNIPLNIKKSLLVINRGNVKLIDTASMNGRSFVNCAGIGFDAHIAHIFSQCRKRSLKTYFRIIAREFSKYKPQHYFLNIDGIKIEKHAYMISFANSSQFGNNVHIAPGAKIDDGLIDIAILNPFPSLSVFKIVWQLLTQRAGRSKYIEMYRGKQVFVNNKETILAHLDGEPVEFTGNLEIKVDPLSLKIIVP